MKVVPLANGIGTIPLRTSKNPVLAVYRHHCGAIASVHQPQGRKANLRYLHCDACGCDQAGGKDYQAKIRENSFESIEALKLSENTSTVTEPTLSGNVTDKLTENLPVTNELPTPLETAPVVVDTVNEPLTPTPEKQTPTPTNKPTDKPTYKVKNDSVKTGLSILLGGLFGGMLSILL